MDVEGGRDLVEGALITVSRSVQPHPVYTLQVRMNHRRNL